MQAVTPGGCRLMCYLAMAAALAVDARAVAAQELPRYEFRKTVSVHGGSLPAGLGPVTFIAAGPGGKLAVAQPRENHVLLLSAEGRLLEVIGSPGDGIGMFRNVLGIGWLADTLWVADQALYRVTIFPPGGAGPYIRESGSARRRGSSQSVPVPIPGGGEFFLRQTEPAGPRVPSMELVAVTQLSGSVTLASVLPVARVQIEYPDGTSRNAGPYPISDHPLFSLAPDGAHVTIVRHNTAIIGSSRYSITRIGMAGDTVLHLEREFTPQRVDESTRMRVISTYVAMNVGRRFQDTAAARRAIMAGLPFPEVHPPVSAIAVGTDGTIWLRGPDDWDGEVAWEVIDPSGRSLYTVRTDRRLEVLAPTPDGVWATSFDDAAGPQITKFTLEPAGAAVPRSPGR